MLTGPATRQGHSEGYAAGRQQNFVERGLMCFGGACAGDEATRIYVAAWLEAFQQALDDLRKEGAEVSDPRDA